MTTVDDILFAPISEHHEATGAEEPAEISAETWREVTASVCQNLEQYLQQNLQQGLLHQNPQQYLQQNLQQGLLHQNLQPGFAFAQYHNFQHLTQTIPVQSFGAGGSDEKVLGCLQPGISLMEAVDQIHKILGGSHH